MMRGLRVLAGGERRRDDERAPRRRSCAAASSTRASGDARAPTACARSTASRSSASSASPAGGVLRTPRAHGHRAARRGVRRRREHRSQAPRHPRGRAQGAPLRRRDAARAGDEGPRAAASATSTFASPTTGSRATTGTSPTVVDGAPAREPRHLPRELHARADLKRAPRAGARCARSRHRRRVQLKPFSTRPLVRGVAARLGRLVLVGEAAGIDATTGEGIAQAILIGGASPRVTSPARCASATAVWTGYAREVLGSRMGRHLLQSAWLARRVYGPATAPTGAPSWPGTPSRGRPAHGGMRASRWPGREGPPRREAGARARRVTPAGSSSTRRRRRAPGAARAFARPRRGRCLGRAGPRPDPAAGATSRSSRARSCARESAGSPGRPSARAPRAGRPAAAPRRRGALPCRDDRARCARSEGTCDRARSSPRSSGSSSGDRSGRRRGRDARWPPGGGVSGGVRPCSGHDPQHAVPRRDREAPVTRARRLRLPVLAQVARHGALRRRDPADADDVDLARRGGGQRALPFGGDLGAARERHERRSSRRRGAARARLARTLGSRRTRASSEPAYSPWGVIGSWAPLSTTTISSSSWIARAGGTPERRRTATVSTSSVSGIMSSGRSDAVA